MSGTENDRPSASPAASDALDDPSASSGGSPAGSAGAEPGSGSGGVAPDDAWTQDESGTDADDGTTGDEDSLGAWEDESEADGGAAPDDAWSRAEEAAGADPEGPTESPLTAAEDLAPERPAEPGWKHARLAWGLGVLLALAGLVWLAAQVRAVTVPLLVAFIIAYLLDPVVDRFEARGVRRTPAIVILLSSFLVVSSLAVLLVLPQVITEFAQVPVKLKVLLGRVVPYLEATFEWQVPANVHDAVATLSRDLEGLQLDKLVAPAGNVLKAVFGGTVNLLASLAGLLMIPIFAFYLLRDFDELIARIGRLVPRSYRQGVTARFREIDVAMSSFIRGQLTVAGILSVLYMAGLSALGLPLALLVGLVAGLGNMVPYLGTIIGLVLATLMALLDWQGIWHLGGVYLVFLVVQSLEGWLITPKIVGESVGLSPFTVIVSVLVFGELFGFFGILIAVPLAAILNILLRVVVEHYQGSAFYQEH